MLGIIRAQRAAVGGVFGDGQGGGSKHEVQTGSRRADLKRVGGRLCVSPRIWASSVQLGLAIGALAAMCVSSLLQTFTHAPREGGATARACYIQHRRQSSASAHSAHRRPSTPLLQLMPAHVFKLVNHTC